MKKIPFFLRSITILITAFIASDCTAPEKPAFWTSLQSDDCAIEKNQLLLKRSDFIAAFSDAYVLQQTDTLLNNFTPFYWVEPMGFAGEQGFSLFKRCIPPSGLYTCWPSDNGFCVCEEFPKPEPSSPDSLEFKPSPCKLTFNERGKFTCAGNCKTGSCTMLVKTDSKKQIWEIGCACLVQLPEKYQLKNSFQSVLYP